ncbi:uncharacterized protein LOC126891943 [Diabrotica virgifera virgifera]|uniref:Uncharacterized protein n=1 Tax=Diabrotica virgifera virgifera TaxID=50390 RepID=A0ABM5L485_DIAVI|nr:uncharacterized protein LOC126891943 [Diabrotica virgifera virgifera]
MIPWTYLTDPDRAYSRGSYAFNSVQPLCSVPVLVLVFVLAYQCSIRNINDNITHAKLRVVKILHYICFTTEGEPRKTRKALRAFPGFRLDDTSEQFLSKCNDVSEKFDLPDLIAICQILDLNYKNEKHDVVVRICSFLNTFINDDETEDDEEEDDVSDIDEDDERRKAEKRQLEDEKRRMQEEKRRLEDERRKNDERREKEKRRLEDERRKMIKDEKKRNDDWKKEDEKTMKDAQKTMKDLKKKKEEDVREETTRIDEDVKGEIMTKGDKYVMKDVDMNEVMTKKDEDTKTDDMTKIFTYMKKLENEAIAQAITLKLDSRIMERLVQDDRNHLH